MRQEDEPWRIHMDYQFVQTSVWLGNWLRQQRPTLLWRGMHQVNQELIIPFKSPFDMLTLGLSLLSTLVYRCMQR